MDTPSEQRGFEVRLFVGGVMIQTLNAEFVGSRHLLVCSFCGRGALVGSASRLHYASNYYGATSA